MPHNNHQLLDAMVILAYQVKHKAFFIFGYAKNEKENINADELNLAKKLAAEMLSYNECELQSLLDHGGGGDRNAMSVRMWRSSESSREHSDRVMLVFR